MHYRRTSRSPHKENIFPCGCCWDYNACKDSAPHAEESEICMGKARKPKPRPKKERCTVTGKPHRWLYDTKREQAFFRKMIKGECDVCLAEIAECKKQNDRYCRLGLDHLVWEPRYRNVWRCSEHGEKVFYTKTTRERICDDCGQYEIVRETDDRPSRRYTHYRRKFILPKRTVTF